MKLQNKFRGYLNNYPYKILNLGTSKALTQSSTEEQ